MKSRHLVLLGNCVLLAGCASVPGETVTSGGLQRDVRDRVLAAAKGADPQCRQQKVINTEVLELHGDGKVSDERWSVDQCGRRIHYRVSFPPAGKGSGFVVRQER